MKIKRKTIIISSGIFLILSLIPIILYYKEFSGNGTSKNSEDWARFADYIGGTTNVILGYINIIITTYIALLIKDLDNERHEQNIFFRKNCFLKNLSLIFIMN